MYVCAYVRVCVCVGAGGGGGALPFKISGLDRVTYIIKRSHIKNRAILKLHIGVCF